MTAGAPYYRPDLAWVHHVGYAGHVGNTQHGIVARLRRHGVASGERVLDVGCGSGLLARVLVAEGYAVTGIDASPAMIELARAHAPGADFRVTGLPTRRRPGADGGLAGADAIVSTGHVLNYLGSRDDVALALAELAAALRPGGLLAIDLMTERFAEARDIRHPHARVEDDWTIVTRFSRPVRTASTVRSRCSGASTASGGAATSTTATSRSKRTRRWKSCG